MTTFTIIALAFAAAILTALTAYALLRFTGKLSVNASGWRADRIGMGGRTLFPAVTVLAAFEPVLKREAWLRRRFAKQKADAAECEVEVEVVSLG
ncbi:MAG: hypothetical protein LBJ46_09540 [Planctomycetota bacterium]|jgi:hypothetical protein|nr:hypothetical protein [Planctomycetota bacterium]